MKFTLEIELGNEEMQTPDDVKRAIVRSLDQQRWPLTALEEGDGNSLREENGNTVGKWQVTA